MNKPSPGTPPPPPPDNAAELRRIEALLRSVDPGRKAAESLSERSRERVLWSWRHPFLAWCIRHHIAISSAVCAIVLAALFAWLLHENRAIEEKTRIPDAVAPPVFILGNPDATQEPTSLP